MEGERKPKKQLEDDAAGGQPLLPSALRSLSKVCTKLNNFSEFCRYNIVPFLMLFHGTKNYPHPEALEAAALVVSPAHCICFVHPETEDGGDSVLLLCHSVSLLHAGTTLFCLMDLP